MILGSFMVFAGSLRPVGNMGSAPVGVLLVGVLIVRSSRLEKL
jgi:hypothetical protein